MNDVDRLCEILIEWNCRRLSGDDAMNMIYNENLFRYVMQAKWLTYCKMSFWSDEMTFFGDFKHKNE